MSAYIVTDKTITAICDGLYRYNIGIQNPKGVEIKREDFTEKDGPRNGYFAWLNAMHEHDIPSPRTMDGYMAVGQALVDMNYMSVNARYQEDSKPHLFKRTRNKKKGELTDMLFDVDFNEAQIVGAIRCYRYQSCECDEYYRSGIPAALNALMTEIAETLAEEKCGESESGYGYWDIR